MSCFHPESDWPTQQSDESELVAGIPTGRGNESRDTSVFNNLQTFYKNAVDASLSRRDLVTKGLMKKKRARSYARLYAVMSRNLRKLRPTWLFQRARRRLIVQRYYQIRDEFAVWDVQIKNEAITFESLCANPSEAVINYRKHWNKFAKLAKSETSIMIGDWWLFEHQPADSEIIRAFVEHFRRNNRK